ncbi:MAG TPA: ABC transporter substrate-binding protein [Actinokineospora sp.]|nr:ABC transporter substrate-binding protein [Actinokineospora sp.]
MRKTLPLLLAAAALAGCSTSAADGDAVKIVVGYQSKTINTVTAGTLLRSQGYFEKRLAELGKRTGKKYTVEWQDYDTGAPITAQMIAEKIDIGSMGDYPLLINGSRAQKLGDKGTKIVSVTGYNLRGGLNSVIVPTNSTVRTLADVKGKTVSTSVGSAAHGLLVQALQAAGIDPKTGVTVENQQPAVGASALQAGNVAALSQFVAWPGALVFAKQAKLLYDGATLNKPTLHGVVVRKPFAAAQPDVLTEFLGAQLDATKYVHENPLAAAKSVAEATGLPAEVVYLYNGPNGVSTFDVTLKEPLRAALRDDVPFLKSIGNIDELDTVKFIDDAPLRAAYGPDYDKAAASTVNQAKITGTDPACGVAVDDPATAGETWVDGEDKTQPAANPRCLLKFVKQQQAAGKKIRVAYVPDAVTGTRWFAEHAVWVNDPAAGPVPFAAPATADEYVAKHPGSAVVPYADAVAAS